MSDEIKMNSLFRDGCKAYNSYLVDDYTDPDNLTVIANFDMDYVQLVSEKMAAYAAHAINNHDRLIEENKRLREFCESLQLDVSNEIKLEQLLRELDSEQKNTNECADG